MTPNKRFATLLVILCLQCVFMGMAGGWSSEEIMASSNVRMEGTKLMEKVTLTVTFRKQTRVRLAVARWFLILANWLAPYEVVQVDKE